MPTAKFFQEVILPEQKSYEDGIVFPAVLSPTTNTPSFTEAIKAQKPWLESFLNKRGVILFRGFPVTSPSEFNDFVEVFGFPEEPYVGGRAPRTKVVGRDYTANEAPLETAIPFYHEMAYGGGVRNEAVMDRECCKAIRIFDKESQRKVWFNNLSTGKIGPMTYDIHDQDVSIHSP
nr:clavaminate synthase-like protein At3g21360 [Tanacetum cinerariifolium]